MTALAMTLGPLEASASAGSSTGRSAGAGLPRPQGSLSLAWAIPANPAGGQLRWLLSVATKPPVASAELREHFDARFLAAVPPSQFDQDLYALHLRAPLRVTFLDAGVTASVLEAGLGSGSARFGLVVGVDGSGLIDALRVSPSPALPRAPTTWPRLDAQLRSLAPSVGFEAATLGTPTTAGAAPACHVLNSLNPTSPRPLGSMFKLYVLATVAHDIRTGRVPWDKAVALTAGLRSLPSGFLQIQPAGTRYTVSQLAQIMVSGSDNTAADALAALVGRTAIVTQVATMSSHGSLDVPFLRTRELFVLKYARYPKYAKAYLRLSKSQRTAYLDRVIDRVPLTQVDLNSAGSGAPRDIGSIEWFASPSDICNAYSYLYADASSPALAPVSTSLSYNDGGIGLSRSIWPLVWFKGGSEQGVLTLGYLARQVDGIVAVVALEFSDPAKAIASDVALQVLADIRAAFALVAASSG